MKTLEWSGLSDKGKVRPLNEDAFLGLCFDSQEAHLLGKIGEASLDSHECVFAVSDGIGGAAAGEFASRIAVEKITKLLPKAFRRTQSGLTADATPVLMELYSQIHRALLFIGDSYSECSSMGATLSLCWFTQEWMFFGHIGDSRIYHLPSGGALRQLSEDDTYVGWLFRNGKINEREARSHPRRNVIQRALGNGHQYVAPQVGAIRMEERDQILICSDGIVDGLFDEQIAEILRASQSSASAFTPAQQLVQAAVQASGRDNTTALVIGVG
jgi:protein phosphatase